VPLIANWQKAMAMKLNFRVSIIALLVVVIGALSIYVINISREQVGLQGVEISGTVNQNHLSTYSYEDLSTISFERTALAVFTANPTLALSSTPFYAEIIYDEVVRNLTEIPSPQRYYYILPTPSAGSTSIPQSENTFDQSCVTVISTMSVSKAASLLTEAARHEIGDSISFGITSQGVEGCNMSFKAVHSEISVQANVGDKQEDQRTTIIEAILRLIINRRDRLEYVAINPQILIFLSPESTTPSINTYYDIVSDAIKQDLTGEALIEAVRGYK
jgi:hypothetical protein